MTKNKPTFVIAGNVALGRILQYGLITEPLKEPVSHELNLDDANSVTSFLQFWTESATSCANRIWITDNSFFVDILGITQAMFKKPEILDLSSLHDFHHFAQEALCLNVMRIHRLAEASNLLYRCLWDIREPNNLRLEVQEQARGTVIE